MESNIKRLREQRRMTQQQLGDILGLSQQIISRMEIDRSKIQVDVLIKLADFFQVTTDYILGYERDENDPAMEHVPGAENAEFSPVIEKLEQMNREERLKMYHVIAKLKPYL